jgi:hypothetical protein
VIDRAQELVLSHRWLYNCLESLRFSYSDGVLSVEGRVRTFYLKQLLQTALRELEGVRQLDNQVVVDRAEV